MATSLLAVPRAAPAQSARDGVPPASRTWIAVGEGLRGWSGPPRGTAELISFGLELAHQRRGHVFSLRLNSVAPGIPYRVGFDEIYDEIGLLYGRALQGLPLHAALRAGLSVVRVCSGAEPCRYGAGMPVIAEAVLRPFPIVGFGVQAFGDLNTAASFGGAAIVLHVGWMPTR